MKKCSICMSSAAMSLQHSVYFPGHKLATVIGKIDRYPLFIYSEKFPIHQNETRPTVLIKLTKQKNCQCQKTFGGVTQMQRSLLSMQDWG